MKISFLSAVNHNTKHYTALCKREDFIEALQPPLLVWITIKSHVIPLRDRVTTKNV